METTAAGIRTAVAHTEFGDFIVPVDDHVGQWMLSGHHYEGDLLRWMIGQITEDAWVFDVGSLFGTHAVPLARHARKGFVDAFEPMDASFNFLWRNANYADNLWCNPEYLGHEDIWGPDMIQGPPGNMGMAQIYSLNGTTRRMRTVDSYRASRLDLIKIDVEGFEPAVVWGARETIERCRPVVVWEDNPPGLLEKLGITDPDLLGFRVMDYLKGVGYRNFGNFNKNRWAAE